MSTSLQHGRNYALIIVALTVLLLVATGCAGTTSGQSSGDGKHASPSATSRPTAPPSSTTRPMATRPPTTRPPAAVPSPVAVVRAYYAAINAHNYAKAWALGGRNLGRPYQQFAQGFADTDHDVLVVLWANGATVAVKVVATQDGGQRRTTYRGTYTVVGGHIVAASLRQVEVSTSTVPQLATNCDPSYPDFCIPPPPPDLDCADIPSQDFTVLSPDPHRFDGDQDGIGCES